VVSLHYSLQLFTYLLTYLLTPWCRVLPEQLTGLQLVKKFPAFHGTRRFITALTSVRHLSLSWAQPNPVHIPTSHLLEIHLNIIHPSTPRSPQWSPYITVCSYLLTPWCRVLPEQLTGLQLVKKFPAFHGTRRFITALTSVRHLSLSWASTTSAFLYLGIPLCGFVTSCVSEHSTKPRPSRHLKDAHFLIIS